MKELFKKITLVLMVLVLIFPNLIGIDNKVSAAGGSGTVSDPFIISNHTEFNNIRNSLNAHYKLSNDIDLSSYPNWVPIGGSFIGSLDGNGFKVTGLKNTTNSSYRGLFYELGPSSVVKNLTIDNADMFGNTYTGILAGRSIGNASSKVNINNLKITGIVTANSGNYIGGLFGQSQYTDIENLTTNISVVPLNIGSYVGGISGYSTYDNLKNSRLNGKVESTFSANGSPSFYGGAFGYTNQSTISNLLMDVNVENIFTGSTGGTGYSVTNFGGVIGQSNSGDVDNVISNGYVRLSSLNNYYKVANNIGGIIGNSNSTRVNKVINKGEVNTTYQVTGANTYYYANNVGGIIGNVNNSLIYNSVNYGDVIYNMPSIWTTISNFGGIIGGGSGSAGSIVKGSTNTLTIENTVNHGNVIVKQNTTITNVGGFAGSLSYPRIFDSYSSGNVDAYSHSLPTMRNVSNVAGFIGSVTDGYNQLGDTYPNINRVYASGNILTFNGGASNYLASGLISSKQIPVTSSFYVGNNITDTFGDNVAYRYGLFHNNSYTSSNNYYNSNQTNSVNALGSTGTYTEAQLKTWVPYSGVGWSNSVWGIEANQSFPYLKGLNSMVKAGTNNVSYPNGVIKLNYVPHVTGNESPIQYQLIIEENRPGTNEWKALTGSYLSNSDSSYDFTIPAGTPGQTKFRWKVRGQNDVGEWSPYNDVWTEFLFANTTTQIKTTFNSASKDLSSLLNKRVMNFSLDNVIDPDIHSYVNLYAELDGISGSKKKIPLPSNTDNSGISKHNSLTDGINGAIASGQYGVQNYKLKLIPNFDMPQNNYDLVIVDAADESKILATLLNDRKAQAINDSLPESFTLKIYAEDNHKQLGTKLENSNVDTVLITIDSRNKVPTFNSMVNDVSDRKFSSNQGFNKIKFSGKVTDIDPKDNLSVYYAVREKSSIVGGKYNVSPATDVKIEDFSHSNFTKGVENASFEATYTVSDSLENGEYVIVVYSVDHRGGTSLQQIIDFNVDRTNPDIKFFAEYGGNIISTPDRQVVPKDSKFKMYFSAYDYVTFEYAGYLVRENEQKPSGIYEDLKTRGAFTNDVKSSFIGLDLSDDNFKKGDMLVFKFRAISSTGVVIEKDVRVIIGDEQSLLSKLTDQYLPSDLQ